MYWEPVPARMREYNPDMKIIVVLRNPVMRAYSHWNHERQAGREPLPFHEALLAEPERAQKLHPRQLRRYSYIDRGFYTRQLQRLWQHFPLAQTLVLKTDDLRGHPNEVLSEVARFLGIASFPPIPVRTVHAREYARPMNVVERSYLIGRIQWGYPASQIAIQACTGTTKRWPAPGRRRPETTQFCLLSAARRVRVWPPRSKRFHHVEAKNVLRSRSQMLARRDPIAVGALGVDIAFREASANDTPAP